MKYTVSGQEVISKVHEITADTIAAAVTEFERRSNIPAEAVEMPDGTVVAIIGHCEGCGMAIFEGAPCTRYEDGVITHVNECPGGGR